MKPDDFEHVDCLNAAFGDHGSFSISIVKHADTGKLYVEVLHGAMSGAERYAYVPADLPPEAVSWDGVWEHLAGVLGTQEGL